MSRPSVAISCLTARSASRTSHPVLRDGQLQRRNRNPAGMVGDGDNQRARGLGCRRPGDGAARRTESEAFRERARDKCPRIRCRAARRLQARRVLLAVDSPRQARRGERKTRTGRTDLVRPVGGRGLARRRRRSSVSVVASRFGDHATPRPTFAPSPHGPCLAGAALLELVARVVHAGARER